MNNVYDPAFEYGGERDLDAFGDSKKFVEYFIAKYGSNIDEKVEKNCYDELKQFMGSSKNSEKVLFIYDYLYSSDYLLVSYCFSDYILYDHRKNSLKYPTFQKLWHKDRNRINDLIDYFNRMVKNHEKDLYRWVAVLRVLNYGSTTVTLLLEKLHSMTGKIPETGNTKPGSEYNFARYHLNNLWNMKFLRRDMLDGLPINLYRGTSIYFTHHVSDVQLIDTLKNIIFKSAAGYGRKRSVKKSVTKRTSNTRKNSESINVCDQGVDNNEIRKIMVKERCSEGDAKIIYNMRLRTSVK